MKFNGSVSIKATNKSRALLGPNSHRCQAFIYNNSKHILYINLDEMASAEEWIVKLFPNDFYELPVTTDGDIFKGGIFGCWNGDGGFARVTELLK